MRPEPQVAEPNVAAGTTSLGAVSLRAESVPAPSVDAGGVRPAIIVDGVSKDFVLPHQRYTTLKERALHPFRADSSDLLHVLRDISFEVGQGEFG